MQSGSPDAGTSFAESTVRSAPNGTFHFCFYFYFYISISISPSILLFIDIVGWTHPRSYFVDVLVSRGDQMGSKGIKGKKEKVVRHSRKKGNELSHKSTYALSSPELRYIAIVPKPNKHYHSIQHTASSFYYVLLTFYTYYPCPYLNFFTYYVCHPTR